MPTDRFYHLPEDKRLNIQKAAIREFTRVPLEQVSINKIVREAGISRGSFYTYFEDKRDVMIYLLQDLTGRIKGVCAESLSRNGGDYFKMTEDVFEYLLMHFKEDDQARFYHNMMMNTDAVEKMMFGSNRTGTRKLHELQMQEWLYQQIDLNKQCYKEQAKERFDLLMEVTTPLMIKIIFEHCFGGRDITETRQKFHDKMELLKCVVYR